MKGKELVETRRKQAQLKAEIRKAVEKHKGGLSILEMLQCLNEVEASIIRWVVRDDTPTDAA